jgi:hypothetical protein
MRPVGDDQSHDCGGSTDVVLRVTLYEMESPMSAVWISGASYGTGTTGRAMREGSCGVVEDALAGHSGHGRTLLRPLPAGAATTSADPFRRSGPSTGLSRPPLLEVDGDRFHGQAVGIDEPMRLVPIAGLHQAAPRGNHQRRQISLGNIVHHDR